MIQVKSISKNFRRLCVVEDVFDKSEIQKILDLQELLKFQKGVVGYSEPETGEYKPIIRNSDIGWIEPNHNSKWIYDRLVDVIPKVNYDFFFHPISVLENIQFSLYEKDQHYDWHYDRFYGQFNKLERKISFSVLLTSPEEYEGGELKIVAMGDFNNILSFKPNAGSIVFFDSLFPHKVEKVASGCRKALVSWVLGENGDII